jgi:ATP-dependent protease ClpP protease subunit
MARDERQKLIAELEKERGENVVVSYITSTRGNFEIQMADDVLPLLYRHLVKHADRSKKGVDLFIHSNGGSGTVPWRIVNLIREFTERFVVLVPHHAFSAATLVALGADEIIMHRMGCLGPIDPSVANPFNPPHPQNPGMPLPISVEDVSSYFELVKEDVGVQHEDQLVDALIALTDKIHPLALGNVQRSHHQSRMLAEKLLKKHMTGDREHQIAQIIENLKSNLFYHGHPINRKEAKNDLNLKVSEAAGTLEETMWKLYLEYDGALQQSSPFSLLHEMEVRVTGPIPQVTTQQIIQQLNLLQAAGIALNPTNTQPIVNLAAAIAAVLNSQASAGKVRVEKFPGAYVESSGLTHVFLTDLTIERTTINSPSGPQEVIKHEVLWQRWEPEA